MNIKDTILRLRKRHSVKNHNYTEYFRLVSKIAKREANKMVKEKLSGNLKTKT